MKAPKKADEPETWLAGFATSLLVAAAVLALATLAGFLLWAIFR
jgi:hypothetical protein